jgi:hypothetical protein
MNLEAGKVVFHPCLNPGSWDKMASVHGYKRMRRYGSIQQVFVAVMIPAIAVGGSGSYLCMTGQGTLQVENPLSGGCLAESGILSTLTECPTLAASESPCGACTDMSLHLDSTLPAKAGACLHLLVTSPAAAWIYSPSVPVALESRALEPAFSPPQDATPSAVRTIVLIV